MKPLHLLPWAIPLVPVVISALSWLMAFCRRSPWWAAVTVTVAGALLIAEAWAFKYLLFDTGFELILYPGLALVLLGLADLLTRRAPRAVVIGTRLAGTALAIVALVVGLKLRSWL